MFIKDKLKIASKRVYSDEGFLQVPAHISRVGIQNYLAVEMGLTDREPTDIIRVFRPAEEVFADTSLSSFASKPITNNHPPELVDSKNSKEFSVGMSGPEITRDGDLVLALLNVTDEDAIKSIESGKVELSNGYTADIDWTPGIAPDGQAFDAIQRNIKGNHIAIVERGRAGESCRVADNLPESGDEVIMAKITIDGVDFEVSDQAAQAVGKLQKRVSDAEEMTQKEKDKAKEAEDQTEEVKKESKKTEDSLNAKLDDALSKIPSAKTLDSLVTERTALVDSIRKVMPEVKWEGKDAMTLRREVVAAKCPNVQMDSVSDDYISARFDTLADAVAQNSQHSLDDALTTTITNNDEKVEDTRPASVIAREKFVEDSRNAWKSKENK